MLTKRSVLAISIQIAIGLVVPGGPLLVIAWRRSPRLRRFVASLRQKIFPAQRRTEPAP